MVEGIYFHVKDNDNLNMKSCHSLRKLARGHTAYINPTQDEGKHSTDGSQQVHDELFKLSCSKC